MNLYNEFVDRIKQLYYIPDITKILNNLFPNCKYKWTEYIGIYDFNNNLIVNLNFRHNVYIIDKHLYNNFKEACDKLNINESQIEKGLFELI